MTAERKTSHAPNQGFSLDRQIGHVLRRAYQTANAHLLKQLKHYDLMPQQFATLVRLRELGATSQNRLGEAVDMPRANIHTMVERLQRRGLVATVADPSDGRRRVVNLTEQGRTLLEELCPIAEESNRIALTALNSGERAMLFDLLQRLR